MEWMSAQQDLAKSVFSLVKYNNGFWKSYKQREFMKKAMSVAYWIHDAELSYLNFGAEIGPHEQSWVLEGEVRWADYGWKSYRRVGYLFAFDEFGISKQFKLHYSYSDNGRSSTINGGKTELIWSRDESVEKPMLEAPVQADKPQSKWIGKVAEWIETEVTIISQRAVGQSAYGVMYQTRMQDNDGNVIIYWGLMRGQIEDGSKINLRAKVKAHDQYKGINQTVVGYAKVK